MVKFGDIDRASIRKQTKMKLYQYEKCETCRKAKKWLDEKGLEYQSVSIRDTPLSKTELWHVLDAHEGQYKKLFNTSSKDYRDPEIKKLSARDDGDGRKTAHFYRPGGMVKRPFPIGDGVLLQGFFKPEIWGVYTGKKEG